MREYMPPSPIKNTMALRDKYFSMAALSLLGLWLAIGGYVTASYTECSEGNFIWPGICIHPLFGYGLLYFLASATAFYGALRFVTE